ncbi:MAG: shikimate 5-dehydrogenase [Ardenticatenaceae bacterium]|nr:MAG: shikimate 5-dehydrogenase [Ardenticatenaceae bacterium]
MQLRIAESSNVRDRITIEHKFIQATLNHIMQDSFAFIIHPLNPKRDVSRKYPALGKLPAWLIEFLSIFYPPVLVSKIEGVQSTENGRFVQGWFVACPLTPNMMLRLPTSLVYRKIVQTGKLAEKLGAQILGLGAFTSVVGDGGISIAKKLNIPVTTGDSYTVAQSVHAVREAAVLLDKPLAESTVAIVGATGAIGSVCAQLLAQDCQKMILIGRRTEKLHEVATAVRQQGGNEVQVSENMEKIAQAHFIITVTSAVDAIIETQHLRPGAVVCDVSRPRDVSKQVAEQRPDVLVIEGGMVEIPGPVNFNFDFGFPQKMAYACMAETMALALDKNYVSFTLGKDIKLSQVQTIDTIAKRHGFKLGGFRSFERAVTSDKIAFVKAAHLSNQNAISAVPYTYPNNKISVESVNL